MRCKSILIFALLLILPLAVSLPVLLLNIRPPHIIFPAITDPAYPSWQYNDPAGSRIENFEVTPEAITLNFTHLEEGSFTGIGINLAEFPAFFDITPYTHILLDLSIHNISYCTVTLKLFADGITDISNSSSYRHLGARIPAELLSVPYTLPISRMQDQAWWLRDYNPRMQPLDRRTFRKASYLLIESPSGEAFPPGLSQLRIHSVTLIRSLRPLYIWLLAGCTLYYFLLTLILRTRRGHISTGPKPREIPPRKLQLESYRDEDLRKISTYLNSHYPDPELSLGKLGRELGLSTGRVSGLIKEAYGITFKQQLNYLRLSEAARLLRETDRLIVDIAFAVGYNDRSYFYKVFRKHRGLSPRDYRSRNS